MTRLETDRVRAALTAEQVIVWYGIVKHVRRGRIRSRCPLCGSSSRAPWSCDVAKGLWFCHSCNAGGDLLDLVAAMEGLHPRRDFPRVLDLAARISGLDTLEDEDLNRRRAVRQAQAEAAEEHCRNLRDEAEARAAERWGQLARCNRAGLTYLEGRGLLAAADHVRMDGRALALPLCREGRVINIVSRLPQAGAKPEGRRLCGTDGAFVRLIDSTQPVAIVEGWADFLSAILLYPDCPVLGAAGAARLEYVARIATSHARRFGAVVVAHPDDAGRRGADRAKDTLVRAGVPPEWIRAADTGTGDLNDWLVDHLGALQAAGRSAPRGPGRPTSYSS